MARDALDPGADGSYPNMPRNPDGTIDRERMPTGLHWQITPSGRKVLVDLTPRDADGNPISPP